MPVAQVSNAPSRAQYEMVVKIVDIHGNRPSGLIVHAASEIPNGEVQIIDVFETRDALDDFTQSRLFPAFAQAGVLDMVQNRPAPEAYEVFDIERL